MGKKSDALIRTEYAAVRIVFGVLGVLPRAAAVAFCIGLMRAVPLVLKNLRRTGMKNLSIAFPEKSDDERKAILRGSFTSLGRVLGELSQFPKYSKERIEEIFSLGLDSESIAVYDRNKSEGRGVLITTGHLGNWELSVLGFAALFRPIDYLARPLDNPKIDALINRLRSRFGNSPINKTNSAMLCIQILRDGGILGILADVNAHPKEGVFVPFFGVPACTTSGPAIFALRSGAMIFPTFCVWEKEEKRYRLIHGSLIEPVRTGDRKRDIVETTALYTAEMEKVIRAYPDQWMWIHRRWKTRPPGEPELYGKDN